MSKRGNSAETITLWSVSIAVATSGLGAALMLLAVYVAIRNLK